MNQLFICAADGMFCGSGFILSSDRDDSCLDLFILMQTHSNEVSRPGSNVAGERHKNTMSQWPTCCISF